MSRKLCWRCYVPDNSAFAQTPGDPPLAASARGAELASCRACTIERNNH